MFRHPMVVVFVLVVASAFCNAQTTKPVQEVDPKDKELASLPVGLQVTHSPNPVKAKVGEPSGYKYTWIYKTTVKSTDGPVTIQEFGALAWIDERWVFWPGKTGKPFTAQDFSDWYSCPNAELKASQEYSDPNNWGAAPELKPMKAKWYFLGVNAKGERVKGEAIIEQRAEVAK